MDNPALVLDLLEWAKARPRTYADVMETWRTSCPRLTIWEDATDAGFVELVSAEGGQPVVKVTDSGQVWLRENRG